MGLRYLRGDGDISLRVGGQHLGKDQFDVQYSKRVSIFPLERPVNLCKQTENKEIPRGLGITSFQDYIFNYPTPIG